MTAVRAQWLTDPRDGLTHAYRHVVAGGRWATLCTVLPPAEPDTLQDPEDEYGRCQACTLALGAELADQQPAGMEWR